jgi:hypothetical protein
MTPIGRWVKNKKADIEYPFEHGEVINYTLDGVSIHHKDTGVLNSVAREEGNS